MGWYVFLENSSNCISRVVFVFLSTVYLYACMWQMLGPHLYCNLWTNVCNSVDDIAFAGLSVVQVAGEDLGTNVPSGVHCLERPLLGLPNGYHSLHPYEFSGSFWQSGFAYSALGLDYPIDFGLIPSGFVIASLRGWPIYNLPLLFLMFIVCLCGTNIFCRYPFGPWPYSPQSAYTLWSLLCPLPKKGRAYTLWVSLLLCLVGELSAQCFTAKLARA